MEIVNNENFKELNDKDLNVCAGGAGSEDGSKCSASRGPLEGNFKYCSSPNHQTVGKGYLANCGGCYRDRICLHCGAVWTEWLSNRTNLWEVWNFGKHSSRW